MIVECDAMRLAAWFDVRAAGLGPDRPVVFGGR